MSAQSPVTLLVAFCGSGLATVVVGTHCECSSQTYHASSWRADSLTNRM